MVLIHQCSECNEQRTYGAAMRRGVHLDCARCKRRTRHHLLASDGTRSSFDPRGITPLYRRAS
jgi:hypothetical protein